jgi:hypothetical protein
MRFAAERLRLPGFRRPLPGASVFPAVADELILTTPDQKHRSRWTLPRWFFPGRGRSPLTYHEKLERWQRCGDRCSLQSGARGQEFVFDTGDYPEAMAWLRGLFRHAG